MKDISLPPQNLEAEEAILGAVLLDGNTFSRVDGLIRPDDFYRASNGLIYQAMNTLHKAGDPIDIITLTEILKKHDQLEKVGGLVYISSLASKLLSGAAIRHHANIVKEQSQKRQIVNTCKKIISEIEQLSVDEIIANVHNSFSGLLDNHGGEIVSMADLSAKLSEYITKRSNNRHELSGITSGFAELDNSLDGFQAGQMYVLGARPGQGKTALSLAFAQNAGVPVGRIDLEMAGHQLGIRVLSNLSQITLYKLRKGFIAKDEWQAIMSSLSEMANLPIYFSLSSYNVLEVEKIVTQMVEKKGVKMLIVDYLQLINSTERKKREQEVAEVSRLMKRLAKTFDIPVIAVAQLNREVESREDKRPILKDLRDSGQIEQDADVIMFLYRDKNAPTVCEVIIAKGRNEGEGVVKLYFDGDRMTFKSGVYEY